MDRRVDAFAIVPIERLDDLAALVRYATKALSEIAHAQIGRDRLDNIAKDLGDVAVIEQPPNMEGSTMLMVLAPASEGKKK